MFSNMDITWSSNVLKYGYYMKKKYFQIWTLHEMGILSIMYVIWSSTAFKYGHYDIARLSDMDMKRNSDILKYGELYM
jgi:hypothetical protein